MLARTRWTLAFGTAILLGILTGCGGGGSPSSGITGGSSPAGVGEGSTSTGVEPSLPAKTLSWAAPESFTDNTQLNPLTDLDGFEIYVNESGSFSDSEIPTAVVSAVDPGTRTITSSFNLSNLSPYLSKGINYQVSMRAVATSGLKSQFSPPVSFSF